MDDTRVDIIIHIDEDLSDSILEFKGEFTPLLITSNIKSGIADANIYYSVPASYQGKLRSEEN